MEPQRFVHNITNYGHKIVPIIKNYSIYDSNDLPWMTWNDKFGLSGALVLTSKGMGYSFNILTVEEMFYVER